MADGKSQFSVQVDETGPEKFGLAVTFDGQRFDCGSYRSRAEAQKAGKLFIERKQGEQRSRKSRPRGRQ
jgi:hypothetical protein